MSELLTAESIVAVYILGVFLIGAGLMFTRKLPALLVLPLMGFFIAAGSAVLIKILASSGSLAVGVDGAIIGRHITTADVFDGVLSKGAIRLAEPIIIAFFGGVLSFVMQKSGVAESLVKNGAELIGDNPLAVCFFSLGLIALLFTSVGGLGAIIMVALVVFPMLATVGVPPVVIGGIMLIGISLGGVLNAGNWSLYITTMNLQVKDIQFFALIAFFLAAAAGALFVVVELFRANVLRSGSLVAIYIVGILTAVAVVLLSILFFVERPVQLERAGAVETDKVVHPIKVIARIIVGIGLGAIMLMHGLDLLNRVKRWRHQIVTINWYAYLIPLIPLVFIMLYDLPILASFLIGFVYAIFVTARPGMISLTVQSMISGAAVVMPAVMLMIGIGILLNSVLGPPGYGDLHGTAWPIQAALGPAFKLLIPTTPWGYVAVFSIAAPLALYRGPLNQWGLGFGIVGLLLASQAMPAAAIMAMLMSVGMIQGICDPTNTQNVWIANELRVDVQALMWRTLPYIWGIAIVGILFSSVWYNKLYPWNEQGVQPAVLVDEQTDPPSIDDTRSPDDVVAEEVAP